MFNMKGILILVAFGVWVNLMIGIKENFETLKEALMSFAGNTAMVITVTYVVFVILGIFLQGEDTDSFA
ncbi:hypothetical protein [Sulfurovum riftiae]|nr:hypothetical protein [Sulfurovum riftiae]